MKRFAHSEFFDSFISSNEQSSSAANGGYSEEFQAMLNSLEEEDSREDGGAAERKRRLRVDQVKGLEKHFEVENKLEPERKMKIAAELELEPRQVTIWFQNRRARWKTKQLERDYGVLKLNYDALKLDYDVLHKQNSSLASKVRELREKVSKDGNSFVEISGKDNENQSLIRKVINEDQSLFDTEEPCNFCSVDQAPSLHWKMLNTDVGGPINANGDIHNRITHIHKAVAFGEPHR